MDFTDFTRSDRHISTTHRVFWPTNTTEDDVSTKERKDFTQKKTQSDGSHGPKIASTRIHWVWAKFKQIKHRVKPAIGNNCMIYCGNWQQMAMVVQMACLSPRMAYQLVLIPCKATVAGKRENGPHDDEEIYGHTKKHQQSWIVYRHSLHHRHQKPCCRHLIFYSGSVTTKRTST